MRHLLLPMTSGLLLILSLAPAPPLSAQHTSLPDRTADLETKVGELRQQLDALTQVAIAATSIAPVARGLAPRWPMTDTSVTQKIRAETNIHITNNGLYGIGCSPPPAAAQLFEFNLNTGNISGNGLGAINCPMSPPPPGG